MGIIKRIIITVFAVSAYFVSSAQLSVEITGDFDGCAPQNLSFGCNISGAGGNVTYSWSSGTGDVSVLATPTFSYINPGHYTLSVTVTSGGQTATDSKEVVIFRGPTANFDDTPRTGCVPYDFFRCIGMRTKRHHCSRRIRRKSTCGRQQAVLYFIFYSG